MQQNIPYSGSQVFEKVTHLMETMNSSDINGKTNLKKLTTIEVVFLVVFSILLLFSMGFLIQYLWNSTVVRVIPGVKTVTYPDAMSLLVLVRLLM